MPRESLLYVLPGRGDVIEGQVWTRRDSDPPYDVEVVKVFFMRGHAADEHVLVLELPREPLLKVVAQSMNERVISISRQEFERDFELVYGPDTETLGKALAHYVSCEAA